MWWVAPAMLWLGVAVAIVGGIIGVVEWYSNLGGEPLLGLAYQAVALTVVLTGIAFILAGIALYIRCSSWCGDCGWDEHPTNTTAPHAD